MRAKQSRADRQKRLEEGRCPIHGCGMTQVFAFYASKWEYPVGFARTMRAVMEDVPSKRAEAALDVVGVRWVAINECPRGDCGIRTYGHSVNGPWHLLPEWAYIIEDALLKR